MVLSCVFMVNWSFLIVLRMKMMGCFVVLSVLISMVKLSVVWVSVLGRIFVLVRIDDWGMVLVWW